MSDPRDVTVVPDWVRETFGAAALELGLYEDESGAAGASPIAPDGRVTPRPAWFEME